MEELRLREATYISLVTWGVRTEWELELLFSDSKEKSHGSLFVLE